MMRAKRKLEHIQYALQLDDGPRSTGFADIRFLHNCLPELHPADINLAVKILGKQLRLPFFIDAITGATDAVTEINGKLAEVAVRTGIGMAVGSEIGTVRSAARQGARSFTVVREVNPDGLVLGNVSATASPEEARAAVELLAADALELHLNAAQELWMTEGDKSTRGIEANIALLKNGLTVPVVVKETGCGIAREEYLRLQKLGVQYFDCAGAGGTNFAAIEAARAGITLSDDFAGWGLPSCWSLLDAATVLREEDVLIASGGIRAAGDIARALALGADAVGIAKPVLRLVVEEGVDAAVDYINALAEELRHYLQLLGCATVQELRRVPLFIAGETRTYIACRGYDLAALCQTRR